MKILFWNVQRLGTKTPEKRAQMFEGILAEVFSGLYNVDLALLCEVSNNLTLSGVTINKQVQVYKRGNHANAAQLGYAAIDQSLDEVELEKVQIPKFNDVFGFKSPRKGGNEFTRQSKRFVASVGAQGGRNVYVYHANASAKASFLVSWVAESLRIEDGADFVLLGDLNCEPNSVKTTMQNLDVDDADFKFRSGGHTHNAKTGLVKTYDYAITGAGKAMKVTALNIRPTIAVISTTPDEDMSDHLPIIVEY